MRFVQLTDPHVVPQERQPVHKFNTADRLRCAVAAVNRLRPAPDFVVMTGDLTNDEQASSYRHVKTLLSELTVPCHVIPGNHDARKPFREVMLGESNPHPQVLTETFIHGECRFILLDTLDEGQVTGVVDSGQLAWLEDILSSNDSRSVVVCMHHPPVVLGVQWLDDLMLQDAHQLLDILDANESVKMVLCGHVHHDFCVARKHYLVHTCPAVSVQFRKEPLPSPAESPLSLMTDDPAAFRIIDVTDGNFETTIHSVPDYP
jgi:3',5'-cyclic-AMP phosphodiesterase